MYNSRLFKLILHSGFCKNKNNLLLKRCSLMAIRCCSSSENLGQIKFIFCNGFFKFNINNNNFIISYWTPLKSILQIIDSTSTYAAVVNKQIIDEKNKVGISPKTPIGYVFSNMQSLSFVHPTMGLCEIEYDGSSQDLIKWKENFESELHFGLEKIKKPETIEEQEISFLEHEKNLLKSDLDPMIRQYKQIISLARTDAHRKFKWGGLFLLSAQLGFVARLTWFEYSWDIMEPITWMLTYAMMVGTFAYYIATSQEYLIPSVERRLTISKFWKLAQKYNFDIVKYHQLRNQLKIVDEKILKIKSVSL